MFANTNFNRDITGWVTSSALSMAGMFESCLFNRDISGWDVSLVTDFSAMFFSAPLFDQDVSAWNVGNANDYTFMFAGASSFSQNLCTTWNTTMNLSAPVLGMFAASGCPNTTFDPDVTVIPITPLCSNC